MIFQSEHLILNISILTTHNLYHFNPLKPIGPYNTLTAKNLVDENFDAEKFDAEKFGPKGMKHLVDEKIGPKRVPILTKK